MKRVALVLGIPEAAISVTQSIGGIGSEKKSTSNGQIRAAHYIRIAHESRKAEPVRQLKFAFNPIYGCPAKSDRKADGRIQELVVVSKVVGVASKHIRIQLELCSERFCQADLVIVAK